MYGIKFMLDISKQHGLSKLHFYSYLRINNQLREIRSFILSNNLRVLTIFNQLIDSVDFEFMKGADNYDENLVFAAGKEDLLEKGAARGEMASVFGGGRSFLDNFVSGEQDPAVFAIEDEKTYAMQKQIDNLNYILSETRKSFSYRLGLKLTWFPRKIREFVKKTGRSLH